MKLVQLNAWGGRLEPQIRNFLRQQQPDILCLQEAISFQAAGSGLFMPVETIQEDCDLPFLAFAPVFSFKYMRETASFGNAVLSRFPISRSETIFTYLSHEPDFMWGKDSSNMRNFIHAKLDVGGTPYNVISHHGFWVPEHKNGNTETLRQMSQIAEYIQNIEGPIILGGDFNLVPHSESLSELNALLRNLSIEYRLKTTRTHLTHKTEVCDYVFVNKAVNVKNFHSSDEIISDHRALILEFEP